MNNMTGDPNQETRPSVFGFEPYPALNVQPINWSSIPFDQGQVSAPSTSQFNPSLGYQTSATENLGSFSFCSTQTPHPAQFPFPNVARSISTNDNVFRGVPTHSLRCKRKTDGPTLQMYKQHITEEKMAEHMSRLHISSETATSSKESDSERTQRLYMCEEMRKLQNESILPQSLLQRIQRPCTALVLWTPPRRVIPLGNNQQINENNNGEEAPDQNNMESDMNNMDFDNM